MAVDWSVWERDGRAEIEVSREKDDRGPYRVWAIGPGGRCLLGTLTPQGERLILRKTLRRAALEQTGCWPVREVECRLSSPVEWGPVPEGLCWADELLRQTVRSARGGIYQKLPRGFALAYPLDCRCPFPLPPLFCFARTKCLAGRLWWIFSFDEKGSPCFSDA